MAYEEAVAQAVALLGRAYAQGEQYLGGAGMNIALLSLGIALYAIVIGAFYTKLSKRVLYSLELHDRLGRPKGTSGSILSGFSFLLHYLLVFPLISLFWFALLSFFLYLISRILSLDAIFVTAISIVVAVRICAYYKEEVAVDVAKLLPLVLLGLVLVEPSMFTKELVITRLEGLSAGVMSFLPYLAFIIPLEFLLSILFALKKAVFPSGEEKKE